MADTFDPAEGAQPLAAPEAASWSLSTAEPVGEIFHNAGDALMPPAGDDDSHTARSGGDLTSGADRALPQSQNDASVDELIATLPARVVEALTANDIEALASGDPQAVARILSEMPDGKTNDDSLPNEPAAALETQPQADSGPERISLRGLAAKDRIALADMVRAVKDGRFASLDEAHAALQPTMAAEHAMPAEPYEAQAQPTEPELDHAIQRIAHLNSLLQEATNAYDSATVLHLNEELVRAKLDLQQAESAWQSGQQVTQHWVHEEAQQIASAQQVHAAELADGAFMDALRDERDLAELRSDPVMDTPDWPSRLMERARQRTYRLPAVGARSQARARGMVASPSTRGAAALSLDEAFDQIEGLSESEVDAVLSQMREREKASRFSRTA